MNKKENVESLMWEFIAPRIPKSSPVLLGGRPQVSDRSAFRGIVFILRTEVPWGNPKEVGCCGMTCRRRLRDWPNEGIFLEAKLDLLNLLRAAGKLELRNVIVESETIRIEGAGKKTGPGPVDRRSLAVSITF